MHIFTHLKPSSVGKTGLGVYADGMAEHDAMVGQLLAKLKELGVEDNTIVMYSTDNGAEAFTWPDGGTTMFRGEKNTNWEGGFRVPTAVRWPGVVKPGTIVNNIGAHEDMLATLLAAAGDTTLPCRRVRDPSGRVRAGAGSASTRDGARRRFGTCAAALLERRAGSVRHHRVRRQGHEAGHARLRAARRAHRRVRQRRHPLAGAADVRAARVRDGPREGARAHAS